MQHSLQAASTRTRRVRARGARRARQGELEFRSWGGARRGAGRKPKGERALLSHDARPIHKARFPLLITSRLRPGLPSLRRAAEAAQIRAALASTNLAARARAERSGQARRIAPFQVVHHSIQSNHLHLIVEAGDRAELTSGLRGLLIRIARALNRLWNRTGAVFADRFHERVLQSPLQVRNALVYVLQNLRKHGICLDGPDPFSSAPEFDGWRPRVERRGAATERRGGRAGRGGGRGEHDRGSMVPKGGPMLLTGAAGAGGRGKEGVGTTWREPLSLLRAARAELPRPGTWLLDCGWRRHGLIDPFECPRVH
jgi:REP-associated tyrosine transposase